MNINSKIFFKVLKKQFNESLIAPSNISHLFSPENGNIFLMALTCD